MEIPFPVIMNRECFVNKVDMGSDRFAVQALRLVYIVCCFVDNHIAIG